MQTRDWSKKSKNPALNWIHSGLYYRNDISIKAQLPTQEATLADARDNIWLRQDESWATVQEGFFSDDVLALHREEYIRLPWLLFYVTRAMTTLWGENS